MKINHLLTFFAALLCAVAANAADYETFVVDNIKYAITGEDTVIVWRGTDELAGEVSIPATVTNSETGTTYTVTAIDKEAFYRNSNITSVTIAEGIKKLETMPSRIQVSSR